MLPNLTHPANAQSPISFTLSGISISSILLHPSNTESPIFSTSPSNFTCLTFPPILINLGISVTFSPNSTVRLSAFSPNPGNDPNDWSYIQFGLFILR